MNPNIKASSNWLPWLFLYSGLAAIYIMARLGNPEAAWVFPVLAWCRIGSLIVVAWNMKNFDVRPRTITFGSTFLGGEAFLAIALYTTGHSAQALISILALALYELARIRVAYSSDDLKIP